MEQNQSEHYLKARRRVNQIKKFYRHLKVYIIINIILLIIKFKLFSFFTERGVQDQGFLDWFELNTIATPVLWGIGLAGHAIYVFVLKAKRFKELTPRFYKEWEQRQIEKYIEEENKKML